MSSNLIGRITVAAVSALGEGEVLRDVELKGFGVRRRTGSPSYFLQTRVKGRLRWITIGSHGSPWNPATARKEALRLLSSVHEGADPTQAKRAARQAPSIAGAAEDFMEDHGPKLKPRTREEYQRLITHTLVPAFGRRLVADLSHADVSSFHARLAKTPRKANFALAVLSKLMAWAEDQGARPPGTNPCRRTGKFAERKRQRFLSDAETERLGEVLHRLDVTHSEPPHVIAAVRLLLLTGCRLNEVLTLQWQHVDVQRGLLLLPDSKTGQKTIYLNDGAKEVLGNLPRVASNPFVIVGNKSGSHLINLQKPWRRIRAEAELSDIRLHDLRHSFASVAAASGASLILIGKLLGHAHPSTTQRYAHLVADQVKDLNEAVGAKLTLGLNAKRGDSV